MGPVSRRKAGAWWHPRGLLSCWGDDAGCADLEAVLGVPMDGPLLTWTTATADGEIENAVLNALWGAVALRALGGHISLLRYRLCLLLMPHRTRGGGRLTAWLEEYLLVVGHSLHAESARAVCEQCSHRSPALFKPAPTPSRAQARMAQIHTRVQEERRVCGEAQKQRVAEVRARLEARQVRPA